MNSNRVKELLQTIASGFVESPEDQLLAILVVVGFILIIVFVYFFQEFRARSGRRRAAEEVYAHLARKFGLSRSEQLLVHRMGEFCRPRDKKYLVLLNPHIFDVCAGKLREREKIPEMTLAALRLKLEFGLRHPEEVPSSSSELPRGMEVTLTQDGKPSMKAHVIRQEPEALVLSLEEDSDVLERGVPLAVYFQNRSGKFAFLSHVLTSTNGVVYLDHSETIKRSQRRMYYRRPVEIPATVGVENKPNRQLATTILELSGGGARIKNPRAAMKPGDRLVLVLRTGTRSMKLPARLVRMSQGDKVLHLTFDNISDAARDRLIGMVLRPKTDLDTSIESSKR